MVIKSVKGHYEAYDELGRFVVSGDTKQEILKFLEEIEK